MDLDLGCRREPTTWVAFEATTCTARTRRRKGARGKATATEIESVVNMGIQGSARREQNLRPEQIEALCLKREPKDRSVTWLDKEDGEGNVEYKYRISDPHPVRLQQLITQMNYRLSEGNGECFYYIGIEDNGYPKGLDPADLEASIATLNRMADALTAYVTLVRHIPAAWGRTAALLRVATSTATEACHTDLRIAVTGSVDAGKSTLVAVLTHGSDGRPLLDNGRGLARMNVFRHKHEMQSGRTSSICHQLLGYDRQGRVVNYATPAATSLTPAEVTSASAKVLTFLDMGGHEKYLKTALYGMTALLPDYGLLCVCAVTGLGCIAREHLAVAMALEVPVALIITKVDSVHPERFAAVVAEVRKVVALTLQHDSGPPSTDSGLGDSGASEERGLVEEASPLVNNETDALASASVLRELHADSLASATTSSGALRVHMPIFAVSAVTGSGLATLHAFLNALQPGGPSKGAGSTLLAPDHPAAGESLGVSTSPFSSCGNEQTSPAADFADVAVPNGGYVPYSSSMDTSQDGSPHAAIQTTFCSSYPDALSFRNDTCGTSQTHPQQHLYSPAAAAQAVAVPTAPMVLAEAQAVHVQVDGTFDVEGVGSVVSGTLLSGLVRLGQELMLGPTAAGYFTRVVVRQLQRSHVAVQQVRAGQTCTIAISPAGTRPVEGPGLDCGAPLATCGSWRHGDSKPSLTLPETMRAVPIGPNPTTTTDLGGNPDSDFMDILAAAQTALGHLGGNEVDDEGVCVSGGGAEDSLFALDVSDSSSSPVATADTCYHISLPEGGSSRGSVPRSGFETPLEADRVAVPLSMAASQSHTNGSLRVDGSMVCGITGLSTLSASAPTRTLAGAAMGGGPAVPPLAFNGMMPPRKGSVLLEPALKPRTNWTFEAVLILLGGHWPPRGLVSRRWPPCCGTDGATRGASSSSDVATARDGAKTVMAEVKPVPATGVSAAVMAASVPIDIVNCGVDELPGRPALGRRRRQRAEGMNSYVVVVHCGSVRQPAHVLMMQELFEGGAKDAAGGSDHHHSTHAGCPERRISASTRAAAALLQGVRAAPTGSPAFSPHSPLSSRGEEQDVGCLVRVIMRWQHRPEWLREGAKLLVGDRCDSRVAGVGFVQRVLF